MSPSLRLDGVRHRYPKKGWALSGISLELGPGVLGLLGPNGAGKSTLMRILATLQAPTEGRVLFNGHDLAKDPEALRAELGYLPQHFGVYPHLSPVELLLYLAAVKGLPRALARRRIEELLHLLNLEEAAARPVGGFSGGMRQRVGIAQALLGDPAVLLVDEPTVGLDPEERMRFRHLLAELAGERIILLSTHIVSDVEASASSIAILADGRLVAHDPPAKLLASAKGKVWEWRVPDDEVQQVRERHRVGGAVRRPDGVHLRVLAQARPSEAAAPVPATLEDAYLLHLEPAVQA